MNRQDLRLELLKTIYDHGFTSEEVIARAKDLEAYVVEDEKMPWESPLPEKRKPGRPKKVIGLT